LASKIVIRSFGRSFDISARFFLIAGPCVVESEKLVFTVADKLADISARLMIPVIFKSSYKKANRTSSKSFRSIGVKKALTILGKLGQRFDVSVLTDIHSEEEAKMAAEYVDILQIPALLSRQTELMEAAGKSGRIVNIKKGQFMSPYDISYAAEKVALTGNKKILITERGTTFGYNNLIVDMRAFPVMKKYGYPVVFDATHSVQLPSSRGGSSGGDASFIVPLAASAVAAGADGVFIETHPEPSKALSDGASMLKLSKLEGLTERLISINRIVKESV